MQQKHVLKGKNLVDDLCAGSALPNPKRLACATLDSAQTPRPEVQQILKQPNSKVIFSLGARALLVAPGLTTRSKKLPVTKGIANY